MRSVMVTLLARVWSIGQNTWGGVNPYTLYFLRLVIVVAEAVPEENLGGVDHNRLGVQRAVGKKEMQPVVVLQELIIQAEAGGNPKAEAGVYSQPC